MARRNNKSIYKCGGKIKKEQGGYIDELSPYAGVASTVGQTMQQVAPKSGFANIGGGLLSGAAAGSAAGLPGMIIGGMAGVVGGIAKTIAGNKEEEKMERIKQEGLTRDSLSKFQAANRQYAEGGSLNEDAMVTQYQGLPHELGGIPLGENTEVEGNEVRGIQSTEDYIFSDELKPKGSNKTYATLAKEAEKRYKGYETDPIAIKSKDRELAILMQEQEAFKKMKFEKEMKKLQTLYPEQFARLQEAEQRQQQQVNSMQEGQMVQNQMNQQSKPNMQQMQSQSPQDMQQMSEEPTEMYKTGGTIKIDPSKKELPEFKTDSLKAANYYLNTLRANKAVRTNYTSTKAEDENIAPGLRAGVKGAEEYAKNNMILSNEDVMKLANSQYGIHPIIQERLSPYDLERIRRAKTYTKTPTTMALGGPIDPPEKKRYTKSKYAEEIARRKAEGIEDLSDIAILKLSELGKYGPEGTEIYSLEDIEDDLSGRPFIPSSNAPSAYKAAIDAGDVEKAKQIIFGYFGTKGSPAIPYNSSTFTESDALGNTIPVSFSQVANFDFIKDPSPEIMKLQEMVANYAPQKRYGGKMKYPEGGKLYVDVPSYYNTGETVSDSPELKTPYINSSWLNTFPNTSSTKTSNPEQQALDLMQKQVNATTSVGLNDFTMGNKNIFHPTGNFVPSSNAVKFPDHSKGFQKEWDDPQGVNKEWYKKGIQLNPEAEGEHMMNLMNDPTVASYVKEFTSDPKIMQSYYDWVAQLPAENKQGIEEYIREKYKNPKFSLEQATGSNLRYGAHHRLLLDPVILQMFDNARTGPPEMIQGKTIPPQVQYNQPPVGGNGGGEDNTGGDVEYGENPLKPFGPNLIAAGVTALPGIGAGIGNFMLANKLKFDRTRPEIINPDYVDPTRPIQQTRDQFAGVKDVVRQQAGSSGNLMSNLIGATAQQTGQEANILAQYDQMNTGISNQAEEYNARAKQSARDTNAQIQMQEAMAKTQLKQQAIDNLVGGVNTGINTFYQSKRDAEKMNLAGGENFYYKRIGPLANQKAVKVFEGNGYHYYEDPVTGERKFLDPKTGKQIKSKESINKYNKDVEETQLALNTSNSSNLDDIWKGLTDDQRNYLMKYLPKAQV